MSRSLTKEECLELSIDIYNQVMELQYKKDRVIKNLSGNLSVCNHCGRKYIICCVCDKAEKQWKNMLTEIEIVSQRDRTGEF